MDRPLGVNGLLNRAADRCGGALSREAVQDVYAAEIPGTPLLVHTCERIGRPFLDVGRGAKRDGWRRDPCWGGGRNLGRYPDSGRRPHGIVIHGRRWVAGG